MNAIDPKLVKAVFSALDSAVDNGYENFVVDSPLTEVAQDLQSNDCDIEKLNAEPGQVKRCVQAWRICHICQTQKVNERSRSSKKLQAEIIDSIWKVFMSILDKQCPEHKEGPPETWTDEQKKCWDLVNDIEDKVTKTVKSVFKRRSR